MPMEDAPRDGSHTPLSPDDLQVLSAIERGAPLPFRASSKLATRGLIESGPDGVAILTDTGARILREKRLASGHLEYEPGSTNHQQSGTQSPHVRSRHHEA